MVRSIFNRFFDDFRSIFRHFGSFFASGEPSASSLSKTFEKLRSRGLSVKIPFFGDFWNPAGAQKSTKTRLFGEKWAPRSVFLQNFAASVVFLDFSISFGSIFNEKSMFFWLIFLNTSCVFFNLATLTIVWFLHIESYVFIFRAFAFFSKNSSKIDAKPQSRKNIESWRSGDPFWDPKSTKIDAGATKDRQTCKTNLFFEVPIFEQFFACEKNKKKSEKKREDAGSAAEQRNARGRWEVRRVNPPGVLHAFHLVREFCFAYSSRPQGCGGFNRYAHSAVPNLDDWMFGGLQVWRIASNDRIMI